MRRICVWMLVLMVAIILMAEAFEVSLSPAAEERAVLYSQKGSSVIEGRIAAAIGADNGKFRVIVDSEKAGKVMLMVQGESCKGIEELPGRRVSVEAELALPQRASNPGELDYKRYLRTQGIYLTGKCSSEELRVGEVDNSLFRGILINRVSLLKYSFNEKMKAALVSFWGKAEEERRALGFRKESGLSDADKEADSSKSAVALGLEKEIGLSDAEELAGLFSGMLFGDKSGLSEETYESFRENGTAHVLCVSGLHVGVIYSGALLLMGKRRRSCAAACLSVLTLAGCALLASFSISVMRAVFMAFLHLLSEKIHKKYDIISAACTTAIVFLFINPYTLFSPGFILSFSAVLSLAVIGGGINRRINKESLISKIMCPIIAIQLGTAPLSLFFFNYFSFSALIANIPVIFLAGIMIPTGMIAFILSCVCGPAEIIFTAVAVCCGILAKMLMFFNTLTGFGGIFGFAAGTPAVFATAAYYIVLLAVFSEHSFLYPITKKRLCSIILICLCFILIAHAHNNKSPQLVFLDVGQGDCIHIRTTEGKNYIVDGGGSVFSDYDVGEKKIMPYLRSRGIGRLDGIIISHMDADHYKGIASVNSIIDTGKVYIYEGYRVSEGEVSKRLSKSPVDFVYLKKGDKVRLGKDVSLEIVFPKKNKGLNLVSSDKGSKVLGEEADLNEFSMVAILDYEGTRILLTGDIGEEEEKKLTNEIACDIVKVPHHGSRYSSSEAFVSNTKASAAVIQVGRNNFGHPAESVIERYNKKGIIVFRNDEDGAVLVYINSDGYKMLGYKSGEKYELQRVQ